jgi:hypothetical protein
MNQLTDLELMLYAIFTQREAFKLTVNKKLKELVAKDGANYSQALSDAVSCQESKVEFEKLINLYGCLGSQSAEFVQTLKEKNAA